MYKFDVKWTSVDSNLTVRTQVQAFYRSALFPDCCGRAVGEPGGRQIDCGGIAGHDDVGTVVDVEDGVKLGDRVGETVDLLSRLTLSNLPSSSFKCSMIDRFGSASGSATKRSAFFGLVLSMVEW